MSLCPSISLLKPDALAHSESLVLMEMPAINAKYGVQAWDVIIVDGPAGYSGDTPGRQQPIATAAKHLAPGGVTFIHDIHRALEAKYVG